MKRAILLAVLLLPACAGWKSNSMTQPMPRNENGLADFLVFAGNGVASGSFHR